MTKLIRDLTLQEVDRAITEEKAYIELHKRHGATGRHHVLTLRELEQARREISRRERHQTPHNKTRLGDLWPVNI